MMRMKKAYSLSLLAVVLALFGEVWQLQAVRPVPKGATATKKPHKKPDALPPVVKIPAGQQYFQPTNRLPGIGLDRQSMSPAVLQFRTSNLIQSQAFSILRDPRAVAWAQTCNDSSLQALFISAAKEAGFPKGLLEGLSFVESGCDPNAKSPSGPAGIIQISKSTAKLMGLRQYSETRLRQVLAQRKLVKKARPGHPAVYKDVPARKEKYKVLVDERLDPSKAVPAAAKYLADMARRYGGVDFALWAYHSGEGRIGQVRKLIGKYRIEDATVPLVFFGNTPEWRKDLYELIGKDMEKDYGPTYYFCVRKGEELLALYRHDPNAYKTLASHYTNPINPNERALNRLWVWNMPKDMFQLNSDLAEARGKRLVTVPEWTEFFSYTLRTNGPEAIGEKDPEHRQLFLQDPPDDIGALEYVAFETRRFWEATHPKGEKDFVALEITALVRSLEYQKLLAKNPNSHTQFPTHCVGAVDISYLRLPKWEVKCLQFVIQDMGWDESLGYFLESTARKTLHFGTSPGRRDFFIRVYQEAEKSYSVRK